MSTLAPPAAAVAALERLIDYAGLFPPAKLAVTQALEGYRAASRGDRAWMLGRFIVPLAALEQMPAGIPLSVIVEARKDAFETLAGARRTGARRIEALEIPPAAASRCAELRSAFGWDDVPVYLELPASGGMEAQIEAAAAHNLRAKLRCGGVEPQMYPSVAGVARFIRCALAARLPFKATAGLHHPVRRNDPQAGVTMHGFLNLLAAAAFAYEHQSIVEAIVAEEDPRAFGLADELRWREHRADAAAIAAVRKRFVGYGSCSFDEPVEDLAGLGILAK